MTTTGTPGPTTEPTATLASGSGAGPAAGPAHQWARRWVDTRFGVGTALLRIVAGLLIAHAAVELFPRSFLDTPLGTLGRGSWLAAFDRWDARYYTTIAARGYPVHQPEFRAFFPGYPLVVRVAYELLGGTLSYAVVGCLVSFAAFIAAAGLLHRLVARHLGGRAALVSTVLFCWFPTSVFFLAPYSEALFALAVVVVLTLVDQGRWWWAALVAGYASATSPESAALTAGLVLAALVARRGIVRAVGYGAVGSAGAIGFVIYLGIRFGDPLAFARVLGDFHRVAVVPFTGVVENVGSIDHVLATTPAAAYHHLAWNLVWMWLVDDLALVAGGAALVTWVVVAVHRWRAQVEGPTVPTRSWVGDHGGGAADPLRVLPGPSLTAWVVVLAGVLVMASSTVIHVPGSPVSTEAGARLVSVALPLYPGLYLMTRRWPALIAAGLGLAVGAAVLTQVLFNLGYWVT